MTREADKQRITLKRLAQAVGVSPMTVSNAFNRPDQLSEELRERILERAEALGYPGPDPLARGLRRGRAGAIGIVSDTGLSYAFDDPAASAVIGGICAVTEREGLGLLLVPSGGTSSLANAMVDGVIVYSVARDDPVLGLALARRLPTVVVDQPLDTGLPTVGILDEDAARAAARHLIDLGHRRYAVVSFGLARDERSGFADDERRRAADYDVSRSRLAGYLHELTAAGIAATEVPIYECAGSDRDAGRDATNRLLAADPPATAILATSDVLALGVLDAAAGAGMSVPADLSVVGFDDVPAAATAQLTTVRQDHHAKGALAGSLLLAALRKESTARVPVLSHELIVRGTTAPPGLS